jgi:hypothetical protein
MNTDEKFRFGAPQFICVDLCDNSHRLLKFIL